MDARGSDSGSERKGLRLQDGAPGEGWGQRPGPQRTTGREREKEEEPRLFHGGDVRLAYAHRLS